VPQPDGGRVNWRKQWYAVAYVDDVDTSRPYACTVLGTPLAVWKDAAGAWHCLEDRCAHRGAPLSGGHAPELNPTGAARCALPCQCAAPLVWGHGVLPRLRH
jgi:phenylpropionate dioxygenase-like ring-hydroxylating dioxygenase large terminal subunit